MKPRRICAEQSQYWIRRRKAAEEQAEDAFEIGRKDHVEPVLSLSGVFARKIYFLMLQQKRIDAHPFGSVAYHYLVMLPSHGCATQTLLCDRVNTRSITIIRSLLSNFRCAKQSIDSVYRLFNNLKKRLCFLLSTPLRHIIRRRSSVSIATTRLFSKSKGITIRFDLSKSRVVMQITPKHCAIIIHRSTRLRKGKRLAW